MARDEKESVEIRKASTYVSGRVYILLMDVLRVIRLQAWTTQVVDIEENGNASAREMKLSQKITKDCELFHPALVKVLEGSQSALSTSMKSKLSPVMWLLEQWT